MDSGISIALIHFPVYNKPGNVVATAISNVDLHDISRVAMTYGLLKFYVATPLKSQRELAQRIKDHWTAGYGASYNPDRKAAMERLAVVESLEQAEQDLKSLTGRVPLLVATGAKSRPGTIGYKEMASVIAGRGGSYLILFGTGWGLEAGLIERCDFLLEPIMAGPGYNHLAVRSAVAIIIDRLFGQLKA